MPINILMPALSPTMEKGNLVKWMKKEGEKVKAGDVIAEIETDKATMEVEAVDEGTLGKILVPEGAQDIAVNAPIAVLLSEGEDKSALSAPPATPAPAKPAPQAAATPPGPPVPETKPSASPAPAAAASASVRRQGRRDRVRQRPLAAMGRRASLPRRWPAAWRRKPASISARSKAPVRTAASCKPTLLRQRPAVRRRPRCCRRPPPQRRRRWRPAWPTSRS